MVQVKFKPQHLVFLMHPMVTSHKTLDFCCGKLREASRAKALRPLGIENGANLVQKLWYLIRLRQQHSQA
jgi:hypothetical protein